MVLKKHAFRYLAMLVMLYLKKKLEMKYSVYLLLIYIMKKDNYIDIVVVTVGQFEK